MNNDKSVTTHYEDIKLLISGSVPDKPVLAIPALTPGLFTSVTPDLTAQLLAKRFAGEEGGYPGMTSDFIPARPEWVLLKDQYETEWLRTFVYDLAGHVLANGGDVVVGPNPRICDSVQAALRSCSWMEAHGDVQVVDGGIAAEVTAGADGAETLTAELLTEMRHELAKRANVAVFVGGATFDFKGRMPGVREEFELFREHRPDGTVVLVTALGGEAARLALEDVHFHACVSLSREHPLTIAFPMAEATIGPRQAAFRVAQAVFGDFQEWDEKAEWLEGAGVLPEPSAPGG